MIQFNAKAKIPWLINFWTKKVKNYSELYFKWQNFQLACDLLYFEFVLLFPIVAVLR